MTALWSCESTCDAERQLQQACGKRAAADKKRKECFHREDQMYSHTCFSRTQLSDRRCFVVGSNKAATRQKPQQDRMPAYFYCCTCWHVTTSHNGIHSACRRSHMASPDAGLYSHTNTVSPEAATTCVLVMVRHSGSTIVALESTGVPMASQRMTLHCPVSSPLVTRMQCCPAACMYGQLAANCAALQPSSCYARAN